MSLELEICGKTAPIRLSPRRELFEAAADFYYLLNRGYNRKLILDLVTSRYSLSRLERLCLYRSVFSKSVSNLRRAKLVKVGALNEYGKLVIDGFNQVSTVASALIGDTLVASTDGLVRDLAATNRKVTLCPLYVSALYFLLSILSRLFKGDVVIVFDSQVSWSKHFAEIARELCKLQSLNCTALLSNKADLTVVVQAKEGIPVASSDSVIVDRVARVFDLAGELGKIISPCAVLEIVVSQVEEAQPT
ncbi:DUF434 domain-containing protein [Infirmifilum sp. SLHALR2]|nr:MAG: hypothetical protein B7L53_07070 [Thermofilum sp. NZ13]